jgi:hypothetical protein
MSIVDIQANGEAVPDEQSAAYGLLRLQVFNACLLNQPATVPAPLHAALCAWAEQVLSSAKGPALGLDPADLSEAMFRALQWAGMPCANAGSLRWDKDVRQMDIAQPEQRGSTMLVPTPEILMNINSVQMRPLRRFIANHFKMRLQAACGISCFIWRSFCPA